MKELFSTLHANVFNGLVSLVLPGLTAISTWFLWLMKAERLREMAARNHAETALVLMLLSIFCGLIVDDIGIRVETLWLDKRREARTNGLHFEEWWRYLRTPFEAEPSGRRHLRTLVSRLKFELGVPVALLIALPALWLNSAISIQLAAAATVVAAALTIYLLFEANTTHEVLGILRHELLFELQVQLVPGKKKVRAVSH